MREIVHIQGGQCGNQIGAKFWEVSRRGAVPALTGALADPRASPRRLSATSMVWTPPAPTMATQTSSWSALTCTSTRPLAVSLAPSSVGPARLCTCIHMHCRTLCSSLQRARVSTSASLGGLPAGGHVSLSAASQLPEMTLLISYTFQLLLAVACMPHERPPACQPRHDPLTRLFRPALQAAMCPAPSLWTSSLVRWTA